MRPVFFESSSELRVWFLDHSEEANELWVGMYKRESGIPSITWDELREEAICFGWAEGKVQPVDQLSYAIRITPRKRGSKWSKKNLEKAMKLLDMGLMEPRGVKALEERDQQYDEEQKIDNLSSAYEEKLKASPQAWSYFEMAAPSYRKAVVRWVMSAKREETRIRRLEVLIESCEEGKKIPPMRSKGD